MWTCVASVASRCLEMTVPLFGGCSSAVGWIQVNCRGLDTGELPGIGNGGTRNAGCWPAFLLWGGWCSRVVTTVVSVAFEAVFLSGKEYGARRCNEIL